jgi:hypothetical protein
MPDTHLSRKTQPGTLCGGKRRRREKEKEGEEMREMGES